MKRSASFTIGKRTIGAGHPCFIIAEVSANHNQKFAKAVAIIKAAAKAGADAIKLQTYTPDTMTIDSNKKWFVVGGKDNPKAWKGKTFYNLYQKAYTPWEWQPKLKKIAESLGLFLFSTPFDSSAVDFLETMNVLFYKIASYEANDIPLIKRVALTKKPVIISVGFATLPEVKLAVSTLRKNGAKDIAVLHCLTAYSDKPQPENANLATIQDIQKRFNVVNGFSDNNGGIEVPVIAASLGASIIEKHVTLRRSDEGYDARFSLEPAEFKEMVERIRFAEQVRGRVHYGPNNEAERYNKQFRRSLFVVEDMKKGEKFTTKNVRSIRPAYGLHTKFFDTILGKQATKDIERGTPLSWKLISKH